MFVRAWLAASPRRGGVGIAMLLCLASGAISAQQAQPTKLLCSMRTGEATATLRVAAGTDPLAASSAQVGEGFEVRAVALGDAAAQGQVARVVVTVLGLEGAGRKVVRWELVNATGDAAQQPSRQPGVARQAASDAVVRPAWMGDIMLADGPGRVIARGGDPFGAVMKAMKDADVRIANLECVIATGGTKAAKPWTFRAHPRVLDVLRRHVDAVSLANNHSGDFGPEAFAQMLNRLQLAGLPYFGGGSNLRAARRPAIIERQGLRIALLGYDEMFPRRFEAGPSSAGIAWADEEQIAADIHAARAQADVVIPFMHWGQEHSEVSPARQRALARLMIRAGVDAVVGAHPHIRQATKIIDGKPVIYSLGNVVFDGFSDADNNTGSILWMTVTAAGVKDWHLQAVHIDRSGSPHPERVAVGPVLLNRAQSQLTGWPAPSCIQVES